jgi:hypothetical protein
MALFGSRTCSLQDNPDAIFHIVSAHVPRIVLRAANRQDWPASSALTLTGASLGGRWVVSGTLVSREQNFGVVLLTTPPTWHDARHAPRYPVSVPCRYTLGSQTYRGTTRDCSYQSLAWVVDSAAPIPQPGDSVLWTLSRAGQIWAGRGVGLRIQSTPTETLVVVRIEDAESAQQIAMLLAAEGWGEA